MTSFWVIIFKKDLHFLQINFTFSAIKIAIIDIRMNAQSPYASSMVCARNIVVLSEYLKADLYWSRWQQHNKNYDVIICGFGSRFSEYNKSAKIIDDNPNAKIFWLVGEYEQSMFPAIHYACIKKGRKVSIIKNHEKDMSKEWVDNQYMLNLNVLIARDPNPLIDKKYDCIYYSRFRPGREKYLKEYLKKDIYFSTDRRNLQNHIEIGCSPKVHIGKLSWQKNCNMFGYEYELEPLNLFRYSLYLEDEFTHTCYNHLANRWYESGFCNNVVFFDHNCMNTIIRSGMPAPEIEDYIVDDYESLIKKINDYRSDFRKHLKTQRSWRKHEAREKYE